jgi:aerobic-type carbon monoxide dehydrogenase small subunit (CoxS/CutS family)
MIIHFTLNDDPVEVALMSGARVLADVLREDFLITAWRRA